MQIKKYLRNAALTMGLALGASSAIAAEPEFTFKLHHFLPPPSMQHSQVFVPWAEKIAQESNGRIKIEIYPAMQLGGKPPMLYDQVRKGIVDMSWTIGGYTPGRFPKATVFELPFMATDAESTSKAIHEFAEKEMAEELKDVHILAMHTHAPGVLHSRDKLIQTGSDLKGMKVRAPNKTMAAAFDYFGANTVFMAVPQMPSALSKGVIDVAVIPYEVVKPLKIYQLAKNHTEIRGDRGLYAQFFIFSMNKKSYNKLPDDLKRVIDNNSGIELAAYIGRKFDESEIVGFEASQEEAGSQFTQIAPEEVEQWKKDLQFVTDDWKKEMTDDGYDAEGLYKLANDLIEKYKN